MAVFVVQPQLGEMNAVVGTDEISQYLAGRYISSNEAVWRILSFPIHERSPAVVHLAGHLENGRVYFTDRNVNEVARNPPATTLTAFFALCQRDAFAKTLLYSDVPTYYTWNTSTKPFQRRKRGLRVEGEPCVFKEHTIGRLYTVHPNQYECFFLRMLLVNVPGPTSFQGLKTLPQCDYYIATTNTLEQSLHLQGHHNDQTTPQSTMSSAPQSTMSSTPQSANDNWTKVSYKRSRSSPDATEMESKQTKNTLHWLHPPSTETSNRFSGLMEANSSDRQHNAAPEHPPKPPPIYIQDATIIPPLLQLLEQVAPRNYETKALAVKYNQQPLTLIGQLSKP
jgi:hypothetical protein